MQQLKERILKEGRVLPGNIIKVDGFLNHRVDTALMGAIFKGEVRIARRLIGAQCSPDQRNGAGQTAAMYAALFEREELLQALSARGADLGARDALGNSVESLRRGELNGTAAAR